MVERGGTDELRPVCQCHTALGQGLLHLAEVREQLVGHPLVGERPQPLRRLQLGAIGGQVLEAYPLGHPHRPARVVARSIEHQQDAPILPGALVGVAPVKGDIGALRGRGTV